MCIDTAVNTAGDATFTNGSIALTDGGQPLGAFSTWAIVVNPDNGGRERRARPSNYPCRPEPSSPSSR